MKNYILTAIDQQLKSCSPENGLEKGKRGTKALRDQITGPRLGTEILFIKMIDEWRGKSIFTDNKEKNNKRNRRRGPRSSIKFKKKKLKMACV